MPLQKQPTLIDRIREIVDSIFTPIPKPVPVPVRVRPDTAPPTRRERW